MVAYLYNRSVKEQRLDGHNGYFGPALKFTLVVLYKAGGNVYQEFPVQNKREARKACATLCATPWNF